MRKDRRKIKELNLLLDEVTGYFVSAFPIIVKNVKDAARKVAETKGNDGYFIQQLADAMRVYDHTRNMIDLVGRPLLQKKDGLYYTGKNR